MPTLPFSCAGKFICSWLYRGGCWGCYLKSSCPLLSALFDTSSEHEDGTAQGCTHNRTLCLPFLCLFALDGCALICPAWCHVCLRRAHVLQSSVGCVYMKASGLNIAFDWALMNACFILLWASETSQELLNNCRKVLRRIRLACPPSVFTFLSLTIALPSVANDFSMWYLFFLLSNLIWCSKCKLLPFPSSWPSSDWGYFLTQCHQNEMLTRWNSNVFDYCRSLEWAA